MSERVRSSRFASWSSAARPASVNRTCTTLFLTGSLPPVRRTGRSISMPRTLRLYYNVVRDGLS